jgi:hypothetical protein
LQIEQVGVGNGQLMGQITDGGGILRLPVSRLVLENNQADGQPHAQYDQHDQSDFGFHNTGNIT